MDESVLLTAKSLLLPLKLILPSTSSRGRPGMAEVKGESARSLPIGEPLKWPQTPCEPKHLYSINGKSCNRIFSPMGAAEFVRIVDSHCILRF